MSRYEKGKAIWCKCIVCGTRYKSRPYSAEHPDVNSCPRCAKRPGCSLFAAALLVLILAACTPALSITPVRVATRTPAPLPTATATATMTATAQMVRARAIVTAMPEYCVVSNTSGMVLNVRRNPGMDQEIVSGLLPGTRVTVIMWGEWAKISTGKIAGYVSSEFCVRGK